MKALTKEDKPTIRATTTVYDNRVVIVEVHADHIRYRLKGTKKVFDMPHDYAIATVRGGIMNLGRGV